MTARRKNLVTETTANQTELIAPLRHISGQTLLEELAGVSPHRHANTAPAESQPVSHAILPLDQVVREAIENAIRACAGNIPRAATLLQISPSTIYRKKAVWDVCPGSETA